MAEIAPVLNSVRSVMTFSADPGASAAWWASALGGVVESDHAFRWLVLADGVELGFHPADEEKNPTGASTVVYWAVTSLDDSLARLIASGATLHRGPLIVASDRRIAQLRDPFGAVIGLDGP